MTKSTIIIILAILLLFAGAVWIAKPNSQNNTAATLNSTGTLQAEETFFDFGVISMADGLASHNFKVTNSSDRDVNVKDISTSCMCTTAFIETMSGEKGPFGMPGMSSRTEANETIKAGESRNIKVVFDPNAHGPAGVGQIDRFVYLADSSGTVLKLEIKASVRP